MGKMRVMLNTLKLLVPAAVLAVTAGQAHAETIAGRASIIDADTIEITGQRIRLLDIDAPESRQPCIRQDGTEWRCGQQAALALADWIGARLVTCETTRKDRYRRWLAHCTVRGADLAGWLAREGWVVPYRECRCEGIRAASADAHIARRGIWSGSFVMPWDWRDSQ
jgi:endonuclease YncB( thermonuclease family)